jgi:hypothetical protein
MAADDDLVTLLSHVCGVPVVTPAVQGYTWTWTPPAFVRMLAPEMWVRYCASDAYRRHLRQTRRIVRGGVRIDPATNRPMYARAVR